MLHSSLPNEPPNSHWGEVHGWHHFTGYVANYLVSCCTLNSLKNTQGWFRCQVVLQTRCCLSLAYTLQALFTLWLDYPAGFPVSQTHSLPAHSEAKDASPKTFYSSFLNDEKWVLIAQKKNWHFFFCWNWSKSLQILDTDLLLSYVLYWVFLPFLFHILSPFWWLFSTFVPSLLHVWCAANVLTDLEYCDWMMRRWSSKHWTHWIHLTTENSAARDKQRISWWMLR